MKLTSRIVPLVGLMLLSLLMLPLQVQSASALSGRREIEGSGSLYAAGAGLARLKGDGFVTITGKGVGYVWVKGAETIQAYGDGEKFAFQGGTLFIGWKGTIHISGSDMVIRMRGAFIQFYAIGSGSALLQGEGIIKVNGYSGEW